MTLHELMEPLSETEKAKLFNACKDVLTEQGMQLLRRLLFEHDILKEKAAFDAAATVETPALAELAELVLGGGYCEFCPIDGGECIVCGGGPRETCNAEETSRGPMLHH
jgi:hypothetical protein